MQEHTVQHTWQSLSDPMQYMVVVQHMPHNYTHTESNETHTSIFAKYMKDLTLQ